MALLTGRDLALGYDGREILRGLDFEVNAGDYLAIVGENGSGKTTLMKAILGLQPPLSGRLETGEGFCLREIGYLPQQTVVQRDFPASVWEIVLSGCLGRLGKRPFYRREDKARARAAIDKLGLGALTRRCYRELSGGQQQRVLLARALCAAERALLLDEPVTGLDPKVTAEMYDILRRLNREDGMTILMVSHDVQAALRDATHILHIGQTVFFGTAEDYVASEAARSFLKGGEAQ